MLARSIKIRIVFAAILAAPFSAASADSIEDRVDAMFSPWDNADAPGCALGVIKDGELIYARGYGLANLEYDIPISPTSVFRMASVSKQFTAFCIALLARDGKLSLDDDVRKYIPELHRFERPATIRHLVHHTSGWPDYFMLAFLRGVGGREVPSPADTLRLLARQESLVFLPGDEYLYSNSGYFLLGVIVERASGVSLNEYATKNIFEPLGMTATRYQDDHRAVVKNRASGYAPVGDGYIIRMTSLDHVGDGGVFTNVEDMLKWDRAFYDGPFDAELLELVQTPGRLNGGGEMHYAFGLNIRRYKGLRTVAHGGSFAGFRTHLLRFPDQRFSVVLLANRMDFSPAALCFKVADLYLGEHYKPGAEADAGETRAIEPVALSRAHLRRFAGSYFDDATGTLATVSVLKDKLRVTGIGAAGSSLALAAVSENEFARDGNPGSRRYTFERIDDEGSNVMRIANPGRPDVEYLRVNRWRPGEADLQELQGNYYSRELDATYSLILKERKLHLIRGREEPGPLRPTVEDRFTFPRLALEFKRGDDGRATAFSVSAGRIRGILFRREE